MTIWRDGTSRRPSSGSRRPTQAPAATTTMSASWRAPVCSDDAAVLGIDRADRRCRHAGVTPGLVARWRASAATMSWANSTPPVSSQKARSTPRASSNGKRRRSSSIVSSVIGRPIAASVVGRAFGPVGAVAGQGERAGRRIKGLAKVAPQQIPCREGRIDHARIAGGIADRDGGSADARRSTRRADWAARPARTARPRGPRAPVPRRC